MSMKVDESGIKSYQDLYNQLSAITTSNVIINSATVFVCCIQALMKWCLTEKTHPLCIYLVDENFARPHGWSYRYFWRQQAKENDGLTIKEVGILSREAADICSVLFQN